MRKTAAQLFVLFSLNLLKLYVSLFYTDHTFSEEVWDMGHVQVHPCLSMAFATKKILKVEQEDWNHPGFLERTFFPDSILDVKIRLKICSSLG